MLLASTTQLEPPPQSSPSRIALERTSAPNLDAPVVFDIEGLAAYYGSFRAVRDVSLQIRANQITAFIGPSGCGKTTVLRCLNRMNDLIPGARVTGKVEYGGV